jgi:hypothetical protein
MEFQALQAGTKPVPWDSEGLIPVGTDQAELEKYLAAQGKDVNDYAVDYDDSGLTGFIS